MRILLVASWFPRGPDDVSGIFVREQAVALSRRYQVDVLVPQIVAWRDLARRQLGVSPGVVRYPEFTVYWCRAFAPVPRWSLRRAYDDSVRSAQRVVESVAREHGMPDIIHAHVMLPGGWIGCRLGEHFGIPVVLTKHARLSETDLKAPLLREFTRTTLTQVRRIIAVSPTLAQEIRAFSDARPIDVVGNLIRTDYFVPGDRGASTPGNSRRMFLYVGLLREEKGIHYLLQAARILLDQGHESFEIVIGGSGPWRTHLRNSAARLGLSQHCRFIGALSRAQVRQWMQRCDVFVLPSLRETFGIVLGEAMACGKPVLATHCGGPDWIVTPETGRLVNKADGQALADAMADFITGRAAYDPAVVRASVIARFGEPSFLEHISAVYRQVLSG